MHTGPESATLRLVAYRTRPFLSALAATLAVLATTSFASAQLLAVRTDTSALPPAPGHFQRHAFVGASGGFALANVTHPGLETPHLYGPSLSLEGGYAPSPYWSVAFAIRHFEQSVVRKTGAERLGAANSWLHTQAECLTCRGSEGGGGAVVATTFLMHSLGPRIDLTPFGTDGPFLGASAGLGLVTLVETQVGVAGSAHAGVQTTIADIVTLAAEGGLEAQKLSAASATVGYAVLALRMAL